MQQKSMKQAKPPSNLRRQKQGGLRFEGSLGKKLLRSHLNKQGGHCSTPLIIATKEA
jgi:hypothetical protein